MERSPLQLCCVVHQEPLLAVVLLLLLLTALVALLALLQLLPGAEQAQREQVCAKTAVHAPAL
jgi:hypothetical protein